MNRVNRDGFTLVELLVVTVLGSLLLLAAYQALTAHQRSYRTGSDLIRGNDALRTTIGVLESELREISANGAAASGGTDLVVIGPDSITVRAQRKTGFICELSRSEKWVVAWVLGDGFAKDDRLLIFADGEPGRHQDDAWVAGTASGTNSTSNSTCSGQWPGPALQKLQLANADLSAVSAGAPIRSYEIITYGLYDFGERRWALGRHREGQAAEYLVGGLASSADGGLQFRYFDGNGQATTDPSAVARIELVARTRTDAGARTPSDMLTSSLFLRNN